MGHTLADGGLGLFRDCPRTTYLGPQVAHPASLQSPVSSILYCYSNQTED
jgi:hypothetical protein